MIEYIIHNLTAFIALLVSISSFFLSLKNYRKSIVKFKLSYDTEYSFSFGFIHYQPYKLLIVYLTIENNSSSDVDISRIKLIDGTKTYISSQIEVADTHNDNGISLLNSTKHLCKPINITSENILKNSRISSYGVLSGYAVFENIEPLREPKNYKLFVETPSKSFSKKIVINPLLGEFQPIHPLKD